jgi:energy-coupling factor transport system substrate-specific component
MENVTTNNARWRTVDIVVASVIAVAFGVVFWAWGLVWSAAEPAFTFFPPARAVLYGVWLTPAVVGGLVIRKIGASLYCETLAAVVSALLGSYWGLLVIAQGMVQGLGGELAFAAFRYRVYRLPVAVLAGALAGFAAGVWDVIFYYPTNSLLGYQVPFVALAAVSSAVIAGAGGWVFTRALAQTGVLDRFPSGRARAAV